MRPTLQRFACVIISLLVSIVLVEIGLRLLTPQWLVFRMAELNPKGSHIGSDQDWPIVKRDGRFYSFTPLSEFRVTHYEFSYITHIDELGGRKNNTTGELIPILGDSFTFGVGVEDSETFVSLLKGKRFLNLGVPGSCLAQQLQIIRDRHKELGSPKVYIFGFFVGNDYGDLIRFYRTKDNLTQPNDSKTYGLLWKINNIAYHNRILKQSYLIQLIKQGLLGVYNKPATRDQFFQIVNPQNVEYRNEAEKGLHRALDELVLLSEELDFAPLFIIIPDRYQEQRAGFEYRAAYYNLDANKLEAEYPTRLLTDQLSHRDIPYFDTSPCLKGDGLYYVQDGHLTAQGHERVADCLEPLSVYLSHHP